MSVAAASTRVAWLLALLIAPATATASTALEACLERRLRPLGGDDRSEARAINGRGLVAGWSSGRDHDTAVIWDRSGRPRALQPLRGDSESRAYGLNDLGQVVGDSEGAITSAVIWTRNGVPRRLAPLPGDAAAQARAVNGKGEAVGFSLGRREIGGPNAGLVEAVVWDAGRRPHRLRPLRGHTEGAALAINEHGRVAGHSSGNDLEDAAVVWNRQGRPRRQGPLRPDEEAEAHAINEAGVTAGDSGDGPSRPIRWRPTPSALRPPPGYDGGSVLGINRRGDTAGYATRRGRHVAVFWTAGGKPVGLPALAGDRGGQAFAVNAARLVAGHSFDAGGTIAVVWRVGPDVRCE